MSWLGPPQESSISTTATGKPHPHPSFPSSLLPLNLLPMSPLALSTSFSRLSRRIQRDGRYAIRHHGPSLPAQVTIPLRCNAECWVMDSGYRGTVRAFLQVCNPRGMRLWKDARLAQIVFHEMSEKTEGYRGIIRDGRGWGINKCVGLVIYQFASFRNIHWDLLYKGKQVLSPFFKFLGSIYLDWRHVYRYHVRDPTIWMSWRADRHCLSSNKEAW